MEKVSSPKTQRTICLVILIVLFALSPVMAQVQNDRPLADAGSSRYAGPDPIVLDGTRSYDPDNSGPLSYTWRQIGGPSVVIIDANTATPIVAGSMQPGTGLDPTPKPSGFAQTDEVQECEFELVVSDGELTSLSDTVKVIIVPDFGANIMRHVNPPFSTNKPTFIYFGGGDCIFGFSGIVGTWDNPDWNSRANVIDFSSGYGPDPNYAPGNVDAPRTYYHLANMIIVYLSRVAPDYQQPIQTAGWSTGGQPAIDVGIYLNRTYVDTRYAINRVTLIDATPHCRSEYSESSATFLSSSVDGEQCCIDDYTSTDGMTGTFPSWSSVFPSVLRVGSSLSHVDIVYWYGNSLMGSDMNQFNHGVVGGAYWSVLGPGKNLQLASTPGIEVYRFEWFGSRNDGHMELVDEQTYPGRLPEPVTLIGPVDVGDPNGFLLTCEESENAVGYELLFGADPYRVIDYEIISDTHATPNHIITTIPSDRTWWTVRVRDQYGSTIYADPISMVAHNPDPADGDVHIDTWVNLSWNEGMRAVSYDVYFGEDFVDVQEGTTEAFRGNQTLTYFTVGLAGFPYPNGFVLGTTYFWRIDDVEANGTVIHKGDVWRFTVADYLIVDDFESYTDDEAAGEAIYQTWIDGFGIADNGAQVGHLMRPYCEQTIVHGGSQSMPLLYVNEAGVTNSEAALKLTALRDWAQAGIAELSLWFHGSSSNAAELMYVVVSSSDGSSVVVTHDDESAATVSSWTQWRIPLQTFADLSINLTDVDKLAIGLGSKGGAARGGSGTMYIDDIRLYASSP